MDNQNDTSKNPTKMDRDLQFTSPCNFEAIENNIFNDDSTTPPLTPPPPKQKHRLKKLVRMMIRNTMWLKGATDNQKNREEHPKDSEKLTFNVNAFKAHIQSCGRLAPTAIAILAKRSDIRTETEVKQIQKIIYRLKCFDR